MNKFNERKKQRTEISNSDLLAYCLQVRKQIEGKREKEKKINLRINQPIEKGKWGDE